MDRVVKKIDDSVRYWNAEHVVKQRQNLFMANTSHQIINQINLIYSAVDDLFVVWNQRLCLHYVLLARDMKDS